MKDRTTSLLVFADLAFFLFAVLAFGYHYVDQQGPNTAIRQMSIQLPFLSKKTGESIQSNTEDPYFILQVGRTGSYTLNGALVLEDDLPTVLSRVTGQHGCLLVDRECTAQQTISALASLNSLNLRGLSIGYIQAKD